MRIKADALIRCGFAAKVMPFTKMWLRDTYEERCIVSLVNYFSK